MEEFGYLADRILRAPFLDAPFRHLLVEDFLREDHLQRVLEDPQVHFEEVPSTTALVEALEDRDYAVQQFPGCISDPEEYVRRYEAEDFPAGRHDNPVESFGITYRIRSYRSPFLAGLLEYLNGPGFKGALEEKFEIQRPTTIMTAVQKNLSHYEISPHPDVREKALTYLLNINAGPFVDDEPVHTELLSFREEWDFIPAYWRTHTERNRCWVPWSWCRTEKVASRNNSILLFAPDVDTLHGIRMRYDHRRFQRTQVYGNLMGTEPIIPQMNWRELESLRAATG